MHPIQYAKRICSVYKLKRHMLAEVRKFDGMAVLHETAQAIERVSGFNTADKLGKVRFIRRIPGYDLYHYLKLKSSGFQDATVIGRAIFGKFIYLPLNRLILTNIMKHNLWKEGQDSEAVQSSIAKLIRTVRRITVHEFVHIVDTESDRLLRREDMDPRLKRELQRRAFRGEYDIGMQYETNTGLGRLPLRELIAIATTSLVLDEHVLTGVSQATFDEYVDVNRTAKRLLNDRIDFVRHLVAYRDFMVDNRHVLAYRFLNTVMPFLGDATVRIIISRPPKFTELLDPSSYET
ncbi:MAG: hypothetical protein ABID61_02450 [Candidatus Micrarchaeota archaeon]